MRELEIWLRKNGWEVKDYWWTNPRFPGKKFGREAALKIQERVDRKQISSLDINLDTKSKASE